MFNRRTVVPHRVTMDDRYREYDIPAGCMVIPNVWSVIHAFQEHPATIDSHYYASHPLQGDVARRQILSRT